MRRILQPLPVVFARVIGTQKTFKYAVLVFLAFIIAARATAQDLKHYSRYNS